MSSLPCSLHVYVPRNARHHRTRSTCATRRDGEISCCPYCSLRCTACHCSNAQHSVSTARKHPVVEGVGPAGWRWGPGIYKPLPPPLTLVQAISMWWLGRQLELKLRPPPYSGFRLRVDRDLAVLLMRSSYQVTDELDFIAMDQFQKSFFLLRQKEWPDYLDAYPPLGIRQGELSDPNYLDFISAVQYATIAGAMKDAPQVFVEKINADGETQVVKRDPALQDNAVLPLEHSKRVGDRILQRCLEAPSAFRPDISAKPTIESLTDNTRKIMDLFTSLNFNAQSSVEQVGDRTIKVVSDAPANLWSLQWLSFRGEKLINDYEAKAITSLFRACGLPGYTHTRDIKGKTVTYTFRT